MQQEQILIPNHFRDFFFFFFFLHILVSTCVVQQLLYTKTIQRLLLVSVPYCNNSSCIKHFRDNPLPTDVAASTMLQQLLLYQNTSDISSCYQFLHQPSKCTHNSYTKHFRDDFFVQISCSDRDIATILIPKKHLKSSFLLQNSCINHSATAYYCTPHFRHFFFPTNSLYQPV